MAAGRLAVVNDNEFELVLPTVTVKLLQTELPVWQMLSVLLPVVLPVTLSNEPLIFRPRTPGLLMLEK